MPPGLVEGLIAVGVALIIVLIVGTCSSLPGRIISFLGGCKEGGTCYHSSCSHCKMPWCYVEPRPIHYSETTGIFPVCTGCFDKLSVDQIVAYTGEVVISWSGYCTDGSGCMEHDGIPSRVREEVILMKRPNYQEPWLRGNVISSKS